MKLHPSITIARLEAAVQRRHATLDNPGICIVCGEGNDGCEPDAREYDCEHCGEPGVFGADELLMEFA